MGPIIAEMNLNYKLTHTVSTFRVQHFNNPVLINFHYPRSNLHPLSSLIKQFNLHNTQQRGMLLPDKSKLWFDRGLRNLESNCAYAYSN